jgi:3-methyladenine DNA glycosylase AlkD
MPVPRPTSSDHPLLNDVLHTLQTLGTPAYRAALARYAIPTERAFGVSVAAVREQARRLGCDHALAAALWHSGWHEARLLACFVDEPKLVGVAQMDRWCRDFDNWAVCDTACFALFDRTTQAWSRLEPWARLQPEFSKRAAFALLWALSRHDVLADDAAFVAGLQLVERHADDDRRFVRKAADMALRAVGKRNPALHAEALALAQRLAARDDRGARWIGRHALRELRSDAVITRLLRR